MLDILHVVSNGPITLLRTGKILAMGHDPSSRRRGICLSENFHATRDMVEVERNWAKVADTDPTIGLRSNWSCRS